MKAQPQTRTTLARFAATLLLVVAAGLPASASSIEKTVPFELDRWYDIGVTDGPITVHRIRLAQRQGKLKSKIFRPGNAEYLSTVRIEIEYSNIDDDDREAELEIHWLDSKGRVIDGYVDEEDFDDDEKHENVTVTLSTLTYGLEIAKAFSYKIDW